MAASAGARTKKMPGPPTSMKIHISHGSDKYELFVDASEQDDSFTINEFCNKIEQLTGVPAANQKLIYKGKSLNSSMTQTFTSIGFTNNCKVMLLGKKLSADDEKHLTTMREVETSVESAEKRLTEYNKHLRDIEGGFLPENLREEGLTKLGRQVLATIESLQVLLEKLDALTLAQSSSDVQGRRKTIVRRIQDDLKLLLASGWSSDIKKYVLETLIDQADSLHAKSEEVSVKLKA